MDNAGLWSRTLIERDKGVISSLTTFLQEISLVERSDEFYWKPGNGVFSIRKFCHLLSNRTVEPSGFSSTWNEI